jgi:hypothetical protein
MVGNFILALVLLNLLVFSFCLLGIGIVSFSGYLMKLRKVDLPDSNKIVNTFVYFFTGSIGKGVTFKRVYVQSLYITLVINFLLLTKEIIKYIW